MKILKPNDKKITGIEFCCNDMAYAILENQIIMKGVSYFRISKGFVFKIRSIDFTIQHCPYCGAKIEIIK